MIDKIAKLPHIANNPENKGPGLIFNKASL